MKNKKQNTKALEVNVKNHKNVGKKMANNTTMKKSKRVGNIKAKPLKRKVVKPSNVKLPTESITKKNISKSLADTANRNVKNMALDQLDKEALKQERIANELIKKNPSLLDYTKIGRKSAEIVKTFGALTPREMCLGKLILRTHLSVCFAKEKNNKSTLAYEIANGLAMGSEMILGLPNTNEPMKVLYIDLELEEADIKERYGNYKFSDNITWIYPIDIENHFNGEITIENIRELCVAYKINFLVVDNLLSFLGKSSASPAVQYVAIQNFKKILRELDLTILLITHMSRKDATKIITQDDMAGGKTAPRFINSAFVINESIKSDNEKKIKYVKHILSRSAEEEKILELKVIPPSIDFKKKKTSKNEILRFEFMGYSKSELEHLPENINDMGRISQRTVIDWDKVFGKDKELLCGELKSRLFELYKINKDAARKTYITVELDKVEGRHGFYKRK